MRRRGPGAAGVLRNQQRQEKVEQLGEQLETVRLEQAKEHFASFRTALTTFVEKHKHRINKDADFRNAFHEMCTAVGVDPLRSNKSILSDLLGVGQFYSELGVQVLTIVLNSREVNGGVIGVSEVLASLHKQGKPDVVASDVARAIADLEVLGGGIKLKRLGNQMLIVSVPEELNSDQNIILEYAPSTNPAGCVTMSMLNEKFGWPSTRIEMVLNFFLREGMVWIDTQEKEKQYWFPSIALGSHAGA